MMKVYSWNVLFKNKKFNQAFDWLTTLDFDILALQEVPEDFLTKLKTLPYTIAYEVDTDRITKKGYIRLYLVILTRYQIVNQVKIVVPDCTLQLRTKIFVWLMHFAAWTKHTNRNVMYVDLLVPGVAKPIRVFCLHLMLAYPALRMTEFKRAMADLNEGFSTIVCGDFNVLESPKLIILNWILGGTMTDVFNFKQERRTMQKSFRELNLENVLYGKITHPFSRSQLDHILVEKNFKVHTAGIIADSKGSDHLPVYTEISI